MAAKPSTPDEITCWVCLAGSGGSDNPGTGKGCGPLLRDCACRGSSAGYAHVKCLIRAAAAETEASFLKTTAPNPIRTLAGRRNEPNPWAECPTCRCPYEGKTQGELASCLWRRYEDSCSRTSNGDNKEKKRPIPSSFKKLVLWTVAKAKAASGELEEAIRFCERLLEMEKEEQEIYSERRCTALEHSVVTQEVEALCIIGECYLDLDNFSLARSSLMEAANLAKTSGGEEYARTLRLLSSVKLAVGEASEALRCIELAVDIMRNIPRCERWNELEFLRCMWVSGVAHCAAELPDRGLNELNDALVGAELSLGEHYSLVRRWRSGIHQYRSLYNGGGSETKEAHDICCGKGGDADLGTTMTRDCEPAQ
mmetsp:Transcript_10337/g.22459  ORF Transcript_10337/g.22459 Transcript_10337/m.22459 type:complete len:368 (-) Transcript_10337:61-1164(-)